MGLLDTRDPGLVIWVLVTRDPSLVSGELRLLGAVDWGMLIVYK